jgi:hypothetical protein
MKDETIYEATPLKRHRLGEGLSENMGLIIALLAIIILIVLLMCCNGNPALAMDLAEVLSMVQL